MTLFEDDLPEYNGLSINNLSRCFKNVLNSYKFYWFLAILDHVAASDDPFISLDELSLRMLSAVWYPLDYFKLSFGKQDSFKNLAVEVSSYMAVDNSLNAPSLLVQIENKLPEPIAGKLKQTIKMVLKRWVTYRFLSPFFTDQLKGLKDQQANNVIEKLTNQEAFLDYTPYRITSNGIVLSEHWIKYFRLHQNILRGFIKYHLIVFLQKNNPSVVGLSEKLEKPRFRDLKTAKIYWGKFIANQNTECIFSHQAVPVIGYSLDHFIPWSYVAHDQLWNILPTIKSVNSSKSDNLPDLGLYLKSFCDLQFDALSFHIKHGNNKLLEDYHLLFKRSDLENIDSRDFSTALTLEVSNSHRVAENLGFKPNYIYR